MLSALCESTPGVELTNAGAYGALNLETLDWHQEVIEALGLDDLHWPELRKQGDVVGHLDLGGRQVPCYTPVGDYQCALVGSLFSDGRSFTQHRHWLPSQPHDPGLDPGRLSNPPLLRREVPEYL